MGFDVYTCTFLTLFSLFFLSRYCVYLFGIKYHSNWFYINIITLIPNKKHSYHPITPHHNFFYGDSGQTLEQFVWRGRRISTIRDIQNPMEQHSEQLAPRDLLLVRLQYFQRGFSTSAILWFYLQFRIQTGHFLKKRRAKVCRIFCQKSTF